VGSAGFSECSDTAFAAFDLGLAATAEEREGGGEKREGCRLGDDEVEDVGRGESVGDGGVCAGGGRDRVNSAVGERGGGEEGVEGVPTTP